MKFIQIMTFENSGLISVSHNTSTELKREMDLLHSPICSVYITNDT